MPTKLYDKIQLLAKRDRVDDALELISRGLQSCKKDIHLPVAEKLRDLLEEISPLSLEEAIAASEKVAELRLLSTKLHASSTFDALRAILSEEDFTNFYFYVKKKVYKDGETLFKQGEIDASMYIVDSGKVRLSYEQDNSHMFLSEVTKGGMFGCAEVFCASVRTLTATSAGDTTVYVLQLEELLKLQATYPTLFSLVYDYCLRASSELQLSFSTSNRRISARHDLSIKMTFVFQNTSTKAPSPVFTGETLDISSGGIAFTTSFSPTQNLRVLIGKMITITLPVPNAETKIIQGRIMSLRNCSTDETSRSVHVKFLKPLSA